VHLSMAAAESKTSIRTLPAPGSRDNLAMRGQNTMPLGGYEGSKTTMGKGQDREKPIFGNVYETDKGPA